MKNVITFISLLVILSLHSLGQTKSKNTAAKNPKKTELNEQKMVIQLEKDFYQAKLENNVGFMDKIFTDNLADTNQYGIVRNKSQFLTLFKTFKTRTLTLDSLNVVLENDTTAVVLGVQTENGDQINFTHNLIKQNGMWKILSIMQKYPEFLILPGIGSYRITGFLKGAEGVAISLMGRNRINLNAAIVKDGKFIMEGKPVRYPDLVNLTTPATRQQASFFLENSDITISGSLDSLSKIKVTGSKTQDEYNEYLSGIETLVSKARTIYEDAMTAERNKDTTRRSQFTIEIEEIRNQQVVLGKEFLRNHPASYAVPVIYMNFFSKLTTEENESIIKSLDPGVAKTHNILIIIEETKAAKAVDIGQKAPDFAMNDVNGNPVSLSSKIGSKLLFIDFWAAWCGPCRRENPNLVKVYNDYKDKGFEVLGVSLDRTKEDWIKAIEKDQLPWMQVSDLLYWNSPVAKLYAVKSIPANFLLDIKGIIVAKNLRGDDLLNKVKELLSE